jgi:hypothetical protein
MLFSYFTSLVASYFVLANATADLLPFEKIQLKAEEIASLDGPASSLLSFADVSPSTVATKKPRSGGCKVFPGDPDWPSDSVWNNLNETLGGALEKTVPLAATCYAGPYYVRTLP